MYTDPPYYLSVYGLARKHGFEGTETEFLASLLTAEVMQIPGGHRVTVKSGNGESTFDVMNGTGAVSSVCGVLPYENGDVPLTPEKVGALGKDDTAASAKKLNQARKVQVQLDSKEAAQFDGSTDIKAGVAGCLPVEHGGHGATDAAGGRKNLGAQAQHKAVTVRLPAESWAANMQTVEAEGVTADNDLIVTPKKESKTAIANAGIDVESQGAGTLTFSCASAPSEDVWVCVLILD